MTILLVEDEPKMAEIIQHGLSAAGFSVDHVSDGLFGLNKAIESPYVLTPVEN
jgi:DNA-binding response OmpR family regulator